MKKGMKIFIGVGCGLLFIGGIAIVVVVVGLNYLVNQSTGTLTPADTVPVDLLQSNRILAVKR